MWIAGSPILSASEAEQQALAEIGSIPCDGNEPVFQEPWEAQAFALTVALHRAGKFTWAEWASALGAELKAAGPQQDGTDYYRHWMSALEKISSAKKLTDEAELQHRKEAWDRAAHATPHGQPIRLSADQA